jgi:hypothetical protein
LCKKRPFRALRKVPTTTGMRLVSHLICLLAAALTPVFGATAELRLPVFTVGTNTFSNVVITATTRERILIQHPHGMAAAHVQDFDLETQEQLLDAGLVSEALAVEIEKALAKRDAALRKAERRANRQSGNVPELSLESAHEESIANILGAQLVAQAEQHEIDCDVESLIGRFGANIVYGISGGILLLSLLRRYLFYRVCKNATGEGSGFVFIPVVCWFVLLRAAKMSRHWLLVPMFALAALFLPPDAVAQFEWAAMVWLGVVALLWLTTGVLYVVWCVKFCRAVERSGWLALLLIPPLIDYIALFVLAFAGAKADDAPLSVQLKKPLLAV